MIWHETRFVFLWLGLHQDILVASSSTSYCICTTIPNLTQNTLPLSLSHTPLHFEVSALISISLSLWKEMAATSNSLLSLTLSQSLNKPRTRRLSLSQSPNSLSLSLQSIHRSNSITCSSLNGPNNTNNQDLPIEKSMFFFHISEFKFSPFCTKLKKKKNLCFQNLILDRFLQNTQHFLRSWILIRYVKFYPTGGSLSKFLVFFLCVFCVFLMNSFFWWWGVVGFHFC